jgi:hypothetical protein
MDFVDAPQVIFAEVAAAHTDKRATFKQFVAAFVDLLMLASASGTLAQCAIAISGSNFASIWSVVREFESSVRRCKVYPKAVDHSSCKLTVAFILPFLFLWH